MPGLSDRRRGCWCCVWAIRRWRGSPGWRWTNRHSTRWWTGRDTAGLAGGSTVVATVHHHNVEWRGHGTKWRTSQPTANDTAIPNITITVKIVAFAGDSTTPAGDV